MAPSSKIDDFRARLKAEPKGRHFFPLAEELRKAGSLAEAEQTLRDGLQIHPNYLSAWVSLGRVLRDGGKHKDAIDALQKALALDANNAVTARLMAETYLSMGEKVEAIKKFKLVNALLPDGELQEQIQALEVELNPTPRPVAVVEEQPAEEISEPFTEEVPQVPVQLAEPRALDDSGLDEAAALLGESTDQSASLSIEAIDEPLADAAADQDSASTEQHEEASPFDEPEAFPHSSSADSEPSPFDETGTNRLRAAPPVRLQTLDEPFGGSEEAEQLSSSSDDDPFGQTHPRPSLAPEFDRSVEETASANSSFTAGESGRTEIIVKRLEQWLARVKR
jgi:tetratricopeptide (TPR) repeat protein